MTAGRSGIKLYPMSATDYLLNGVLVALVLIQIRPHRLTVAQAVRPLAIVAVAALAYLHSFPTAGNDLVLELGCLALGAALGVGCALFTKVWRSDQGLMFRAGAVAAVLWIIGVGSRIAFAQYVSHGGAKEIGTFSVQHHITGSAAWVAALVSMALAEVVFRTAVIQLRAWRVRQEGEVPVPAVAAA
jgi:hypothetical protein